MNKDYVWTFDASGLASGLNGEFSLEYHVTGLRVDVDPEALVGARIWLVIKKGAEHYLYAFISPVLIQRYKEGKYKGDLLFKCDPFSSVRLLPRREAVDPWKTSVESNELRECASWEQAAFEEMVRKNLREGFAKPSEYIFDSIGRTTFDDLEHAVPDQLLSTFRTVSYGDVSRWRSLPENISALGGLTLEILGLTHPHLDKEYVVRLISSLDPLTVGSHESLKTSADIRKVLSALPPLVDTFFEEIDSDRISPRTFVAKTPGYSIDWLEKTNDAEQAHEQILKDVVVHLKSIGYKVYKTRSFDVFAERENVRFLFEVKSASKLNTVSQGEKGLVQLLRYSMALKGTHLDGIRYLLLLQDAKQPAVHQYLSRMAELVGSELWLYDSSKEWPERISNSASCILVDS